MTTIREQSITDDKGTRTVLEAAVRLEPTAYDEVVADIRQRVSSGERTPVLARHMQALGLDDMLLALAKGA